MVISLHFLTDMPSDQTSYHFAPLFSMVDIGEIGSGRGKRGAISYPEPCMQYNAAS